MKSKELRLVLTTALILIVAIALLRAFARAPKGPPDQKGREEQQEGVQAPSRVLVRKGETLIRLSAQAQVRAGIETERLQAVRERREVVAPAVVLDVQGLVTLAANYAAAQANLYKAENDLSVSQREDERLKALYNDQQNVSTKAFEAAEAAFHNDQTDAAMAKRNLGFQMAALRQNWGNEIANWAASGSTSLERILNREDVLVEVTLPPQNLAAAPAEVALELPNGRRAAAKLVSGFPHVDPRLQGATYLYLTRTVGALAPGLNLTAQLAAGSRLAGVLVPSAAIVWWQGEAWVYVQTGASEFTRRPIPASFPVAGGVFVAKSLSPGQRIVRAGAQALLSEEFRSQIRTED
jgi:hypothetical protein